MATMVMRPFGQCQHSAALKQWSVLVADDVVPQVHVCPYLPLLTQRHLTEPHVPPLVPLLHVPPSKNGDVLVALHKPVRLAALSI